MACSSPYKILTCEKSALQLAVQREGLVWNPGCRLPWRKRSCLGKNIRWDERTPALLLLDPGKTYAVQYTLRVCVKSSAGGEGLILLQQPPCGAFADTSPLRISMERLSRCPQTLRYAAVLRPRADGGQEAELSLVWEGKSPLCVERAAMDVTEL